MTYQEIKDRLTKCESTLESLKNGSYSNIQPTEVQKTVKQLKVLQESLQSQLAEASKKTYLVTPKSGETSALSLDDKEVDALEDADDIEGIKGADGSEVKEMSDDEFAQAQQNQRLEDHPEKDMIKKIQALIAKEKKIKEGEGASEEEEATFHKKLDTLVHNTFGKRPEEEDMNEAPEGMYYIKIPKDVASQNKAQVIFDDLYGIKYEINDDPEGIVMYFKKEDFDAGVIDDLEGDGVQILDTNVPMNEVDGTEQDGEETPEGGMDQGGDFDVAHQDDEPNMLKKDIYDIATYAAKLYKQLDKYDKHDGEVDFPHWWQKKVTLAREYISSAQHFLEAEEKQPALDQLALESKVNEGRGDMKTIVDLISDRAAESGLSPKEEAMEVMEAIGEYYEINFEYGRISEELDEMVDPSYADMLAQFIILMGSGYGALQAVKKLGDETGDISLDSVKKAIKKYKEGQPNEIDEASLAKIQKAHSLVVAKMKELAQHYKTGDTSVVPQLKDLTAKKKELERQLDDKVAGTGRDQELSIQEAESTCCGKCGRKHVKGTKCKTPYLKGKDHCRTR